MTETIDTSYFAPLRRVTACARIARGVELTVDDAVFQAEVLGDGLLRLRLRRGGAIFDERPTHAVSTDLSALSAPFEVSEDDHAVRLQTARMTLVVGRAPFRLDAFRADGSVIFETATVDDRPWAYAALNDEFLLARRSAPDDEILGLGEKTGRLDRRGRNFTLWNTDVLDPDAGGQFTKSLDRSDPRADPTSTEFDPYYVSIPFFQRVDAATGVAAGSFVDNGYRGRYEFGHAGQYRIHFAAGQYTEYVFAGPSLKAILADYTMLTGRMPAPPLWALGYQHCRWHPYAQSDVEALAAQYRDKNIPCDAIWLDIDYMDGYRVFTWNRAAFPDVPGMLGRLSERGFRAVTIIDPGVKAEPGYEVYDDGLAQDVFCRTAGGAVYTGQVWPGKTAFPDFTTERGRRWWGERNAAHIQSGLAGIWNDMNEPATGAIPEGAMRFDGGRDPHDRWHNQYALLMALGTVEGLRAAMPDRRTFVLSRAGSAGIQRYAANWLGDNMSRWEHLWMSLPMAQGMGLSGQPFVGADVGGFGGDCTAELLVRWMQCAALTPFCRHHNMAGSVEQYPWSFGAETEELCRQSLALRYRLMPALYSLFIEASETGLPVQRPLALEFQSDPQARAADDQFLLGPRLLVAPVYAPGVVSRPVYLPAGTWHDWFTGAVLSGGRTVTADAPRNRIPLYARGGAVVPMWPEAPSSTMGYHPRSMELHLFLPAADGEWCSRLHEDDGLTFAFREGAFRRTDFCVRRVGAALTLEATASGDGYPDFAREEFALVFHGGPVGRVTVDGRDVPVQNGVVSLGNSGQSFVLAAYLG